MTDYSHAIRDLQARTRILNQDVRELRKELQAERRERSELQRLVRHLETRIAEADSG